MFVPAGDLRARIAPGAERERRFRQRAGIAITARAAPALGLTPGRDIVPRLSATVTFCCKAGNF
jgi:hypothetical protein